MDLKKVLLSGLAIVVSLGFLSETATAQWSIGGSYEIRNEDPQNGFGVRLERDLLQPAPIVDLGLRAHFSHFSEDNYVGSNNITYGDINQYDYGLAAVGGISVGLVAPYVGLGLGSSTMELEDDGSEIGSESSLYWNGFVGAKVSPIPYIKPFVEYRLQSTEEYEDFTEDMDTSDGRLIFGVYVTF